tara:strand:+ start:359 stop:523 length:165 start_codon:yes stop_codon:yes gene_type:complete
VRRDRSNEVFLQSRQKLGEPLGVPIFPLIAKKADRMLWLHNENHKLQKRAAGKN